MISHVHVIGDACIADAMPKSASAAYSHARQCASAIVALLAGREVPEPSFDSVCYSMLAPQAREAQRWYRSIRADSFTG